VLTAKVSVQFDGDWTEELRRYNVFGEFLASTFRNRQYIGLMTLETDDFEGTREAIESHRDVESIEVIETYTLDHSSRTNATLFIRGSLSQFSPLQTLMYEGFLPIGPTKLENGRECFDLLLQDRDELADVTDILREFGSVQIERISQDRQRELLTLALERGYFNIPRDVTLEELADEMGITKTTASNHLRKAEQQVMEFLIQYITLASEE
jgi:predicted DNA binding protein